MILFIRRYTKFFIYLLILIIIFLILALLAKSHPYFGIDLAVTRFIQGIDLIGFSSLMIFLSFLGEGEVIFPLGLLAALLLYIKKFKHQSLFLIISFVTSAIFSLFFKLLIGRVRPDPDLVTQYYLFLYNDSFPSGHVLVYIGLFGFLLFLVYTQFPKSWLKTLGISILLGLLGLIGVSRIYLGAHWFSDVVGAYVLGLLILSIIIFLYKRFILNDTAQ